jgi:hypothetical protein
VYCYLKHDEVAPLLARRLMRHLGLPILPAGDEAEPRAEGEAGAKDAAVGAPLEVSSVAPKKRSPARRTR